jgi:hypothetical protein
MLRRVPVVRTDVSNKCSASTIRVTIIGELGMLAVTSNRRTVRRLEPEPSPPWEASDQPPELRHGRVTVPAEHCAVNSRGGVKMQLDESRPQS